MADGWGDVWGDEWGGGGVITTPSPYVSLWRLSLENLSGNSVITPNIPFLSAQVRWVLNGPGSLEVSVNMRESSIVNIEPAKHRFTLTYDGTRVWSGIITSARLSMSQDKGHQLTFQATGIFERLRHVYVDVDLEYSDTSAEAIAWELIRFAQAKSGANFGISHGSHTGSSTKVDRAYCALELPSIGDSIEELSTMDDGIDWVIGPCISFSNRGLFKTYTPRRGTTKVTTLAQNKLSSLEYTQDSTDMGNYIYSVGTDDCNPPMEIITNPTSIGEYGLSERVEEFETHSLRDLKAYGNEKLRNYHRPIGQATARYWVNNGPAFGVFDVGDIITLAGNLGYSNFSRSMRVQAITIDMSPPAVDFWSVDLSSVVS